MKKPMKAKPGIPTRTAQQRAEEKSVREYFQRERPTLKQLLARGDYDGPFEQGKYIEKRLALAKLKKDGKNSAVSKSARR